MIFTTPSLPYFSGRASRQSGTGGLRLLGVMVGSLQAQITIVGSLQAARAMDGELRR
jgi:hypothetical protein